MAPPPALSLILDITLSSRKVYYDVVYYINPAVELVTWTSVFASEGLGTMW